jgi:hypothetical protein
MFMARPAIIAAHDILLRATASVPSRYAATSDSPASRTASSAMPSPMGVRHFATMAAMAWASASMPVWAVIAGGIEWVRIGSTSATCARMSALAMPALRPASGSEMTAPPETSEPVPELVGSATSATVGSG